MRHLSKFLLPVTLSASLLAGSAATAGTLYWNIFNIEGENQIDPSIVTYGTLADMLNDENRLDFFSPDNSFNGDFAPNVVGGGSDGSTFWNVFNVEGESDQDAVFVTYATASDMLNDDNRLDVHYPDGSFSGDFAPNIVGSGSDGSTYWNVFNIEGESDMSAIFVTYATLNDMLNDENRLDTHTPDGSFSGNFAPNIVGSGSDGTTYWSLFNIEGERDLRAAFVTYATLDDMLNDENRLDVFDPDGSFNGDFGINIVGTGAVFIPDVPQVPVPATLPLLAGAMGVIGWVGRRRG